MNEPVGLVPPAIESRARPNGRAAIAVAPRGLFLLGLGAAWIAPAFVSVRFLWALAAWNLAVIVLWAIDLGRIPRAASLRVRREWLAPPALSVPSSARVTVFNDAGVAVRARFVDALAPQLAAGPAEGTLAIEPHADAAATCAIRPNARGTCAVGDIYVRYRSPFQVAERWARADLAQTVVSYPNLEDAGRQAIRLIRSRQIELEKRATRLRGTGRMFESLREYRQGDELRDICWTASARRGKLATRLYEIERSQTMWVLVDAGRLMRARVSGLSKLDYAVNAALALSEVALETGDRVGLIAYTRRIAHRLPAARGRGHLKNLVEMLARVTEDEWEADHLQAAGRLLSDQQRRSLVVWITDLAETAATPDVIRAAARLMTHHVVLFIVIGQPDLQAMADRRPATVPEMFETAAAQTLALRRARLLASIRGGGALALETSAAQLTTAAVNGYLDIKARGRI